MWFQQRTLRDSGTRLGMTLIEMLVATTMTLIIMGVVAQLFGFVGNGVSASRAALEMSAQLRAVSHTLRTDLGGITVETVPPVRVESDTGYLEIIEGVNTDTGTLTAPDSRLTGLNGDWDDVLMFTTESPGKPFVGSFGGSGNLIESPYAEVVWFCVPAANQPVSGTTLYNLHRRQLLVIHYVGDGSSTFHGANSNSIATSLPVAYGNYDLSMRRDAGINRTFPNGLSDLTKRENRFLHNNSGTVSAAAFPYETTFLGNLATDGPLSGSRVGEDIVLSNVLSFDVRVFDPNTEVKNHSVGGVAVTPGDPGYASAASFSTPVYGCYVDIGVVGANTFASGNKDALSQLAGNIYDTWSTHYEANGLDEDSAFGTDQLTNGQDDDGNGIVDDEQETSPPYPYPLRGIEVRIRVYEPSSRQVRQVTVRHTFVPH